MFHRLFSIFAITLSTSGAAIAADRCFVDEKSIEVINVKNFGAIGDGKADDTKALQKALDSVLPAGGKVIIPKGTYMIDALRGIQLKSNTKLFLDSESYLKAIPNSSGSYSIVRITDAENIAMVGGNLVGERHEHAGTTGEWGMGLSIRKSRNVTIKNVTATDNWGDGFYISNQSENIVFCSVTADGNRRQGMSIISGNHIFVYDSIFKNTGGAKPEAGIDIEPNQGDIARNIVISNSKFINNAGAGIASYVAPGNKKASISDVLIEKNMVANNKSGGSLAFNSTNVRVIENLFIKNTGDAIYFDKESHGGIIDKNVVYRNNSSEHELKNQGKNTEGDNIFRQQTP